MRTLLVNALSVTNQSGLHVLAGHCRGLVAQLQGVVRLVVLCREDMDALRSILGDQVDWVFAPAATRGWFARAHWEWWHLRRVIRKSRANAYFTPSGMAAGWLQVPQLVLCQNPWALVPAARRRRDAVKAWLQRMGYRRTMRVAEVVIFNSRFMQEAYRAHAGREERKGVIVYQAPDDATHARAVAWRGRERKRGQIVCISAMAPHKNIETVVRAVARLHAKGGLDVSLQLVGGWPDPAYERRIQRLIRRLHLTDIVHVTGFVSRDVLDQYLASSQVFCLLSRCESFGIPAIEAQCFGTPVVSANVCAVPEICGEGGWYFDPDDVEGVAKALARLLGESTAWLRMSQAARMNADRYMWTKCTAPLADGVRKVVQR